MEVRREFSLRRPRPTRQRAGLLTMRISLGKKVVNSSMIQTSRTRRAGALTIALFFIIAVSFCRPLPADSARELQLAVHQLTVFLGTDADAQNWRRLLDLNTLETQAAKGESANVKDLTQVLKRFNADTPGLDQPIFMTVKDALQRQIEHLSKTEKIDPYDAIKQARKQLTPIPQKEIEYRRDQAVFDLQGFVDQYKATVDEETRNAVFEKLKPIEMIEFLKGITIEIPDMRTPQSIQQEIDNAEKGLAELDKQLASLNQQMDQIHKWLKELKRKDKKNLGEGPVPDDEQGKPNTQLGDSKKQDPITPKSANQDKIKLASSLKTLEQEKKKLEKSIARLKDDLENLDVNKKDRIKRRNQIGRAMAPYQRAFDDLQLDQRDVHFAKANYSFSRFRNIFANGTNPTLQTAVNANLDVIQKNLNALADPSNRQAQALIGKALGDLHASNQASPLIAAIRTAHSQPNLEVSVSSELINQLGGRSVEETQSVRENILGRLILGEALVTGDVSIDLVPDPNQAHIRLQLLGNVESDTYTKQGRITAYAEGSAEVEAQRNIFINTSGLFVTDVEAMANLVSRYKGVSSRCKLIKRVAKKQYMKDKKLSEKISAQRLEDKMKKQFLQQSDDVLKEGQERIDNFQNQRANNLALLPEIFLTTTSDHFNITGIKSSPYDLAAPVAPQSATDMKTGIGVRVNETALSNYASPFLAGKAFWNYDLADRLEKLLDVDMTNLREGENGDWQILFSDKRPVQFEFDNDRFSVVVTGLKFRQGQNTINYGLKIRLTFKIVRKDGKLFFERDGKAVVDYLTEQKDGKTVAFKTGLERQLNKANEEGTGPDVSLPENLIPVDGELLKDVPLAKQLKLVQFRAKNGWLYVGWNYVAEGETYSGPVETPGIFNE